MRARAVVTRPGPPVFPRGKRCFAGGKCSRSIGVDQLLPTA